MGSRTWRAKSLRWEVATPFEQAKELARDIRTSPLVAQILHNRGVSDADTARAFLEPKLKDLHPPEALRGMTGACERIIDAVHNGERIMIYGDYDVDGITGVAILHGCLKMVDADVHYYIPHRLEEGYGLNVKAVRKILSRNTRVLITVDCGICATEPIAEANSHGTDVIVTDHHLPPEQLPPAHSIVHPLVPRGEYPNEELSGAGVAFKLAWELARRFSGGDRVDEKMRDFLLDATTLGALGTIADVVPLVGENRVLAVYGLKALPQTRNVGLRALLDSARLTGESLDAYHVAFVLGPRLNAAGRMGHARLAVELLTTTSESRAREIAEYIEKQNTARQKVEREISQEAFEMVERGELDDPSRRAIVLSSRQWHGGVIGIVASRLVDRFHRPTILIAIDDNGFGQGSARSIPGFHMRDALAACSDHLEEFGGHAMAGGLRIRPEDIDPFIDAFLRYTSQSLGENQLVPSLQIDAETTLSSLDYNAVEKISRLQPFGEANPAPILAFRNCRILTPPRRMGQNGRTAAMTIEQNGARIRCVGFGMGDLADHLVGINRVDVAGTPMFNTFNQTTSIELRLHDVIWE